MCKHIQINQVNFLPRSWAAPSMYKKIKSIGGHIYGTLSISPAPSLERPTSKAPVVVLL
jgi:hypothetical protein